MQDDPPQDERKQRAKQLRDQWQRKREQSHVDLASLSTRERNDFFIEIVVWWCGAVLFLLGAVICALLCILPIFLGQKITFFDAFFNDALPETAWRPVLAGLGFFVCLFVARWMSRSPSRRAKARQNAVKRGDDPPQENEFGNMLGDAPTTPPDHTGLNDEIF